VRRKTAGRQIHAQAANYAMLFAFLLQASHMPLAAKRNNRCPDQLSRRAIATATNMTAPLKFQ